MYVISVDKHRATTAVQSLLAALPVQAGTIHAVELGSHWIVWSKAQANENLHLFEDGAVLGKLDVAEQGSTNPIVHEGPLPTTLPPLLPGLVVRSTPDALTVEPLGTTTAFHRGSSVSDRQLLLAAEAGLRPSAAGVAVLTALGFFPGNLSLFDEVQRIPFLHRWDVRTREARRTRELSLHKADDDAMIERLTSIVPQGRPNAIGLSGGFDSRFVFGVLRRATGDARILRFTDVETEVVEAIAEAVGVCVESAGGFNDADTKWGASDFTMLSDAQIWFGSHQPSRLRSFLGPEDYYHSGQFSDSIIKNAFKTAWKVPNLRVPFWQHLVDTALTGGIPVERPILREANDRASVVELLQGSVAYQREYVDFRSKKQLANWLYYMNRGMRWAQAFYSDLGFYSNPVFLLSDVDALMLGIGSGFWENFNNDRVKVLNRRLLPEVDVGYVNGQPVLPAKGLAGAIRKLDYEYVYRVRQKRSATKALRSSQPTFAAQLPAGTPNGWDELYTVPMEVAANSGPYGVGHAAVTVAHVLDFLDRVPAATRS